MKTKLIILMGLLALGAMAQNFAVRFLWQDPRHEFHRSSGCPTNWPAAVDRLGLGQTNPWPDRVVLSQEELDSVYRSAGASFSNWHQNVWQPFEAQQEQSAMRVSSNNVAELKTLYQEMVVFEERWQQGLQATNTAQINAVLRSHNAAMLRLRPLLERLYHAGEQ